MSIAKTYINDQLILEDVASDMMTMIGFEDTSESSYLDITSSDFFERQSPVHGKYLVYYGDENLFICITKNRNILVFLSSKFSVSNKEYTKYDYLVKMFTFSGLLTELSLEDMGLTCHKEGDDLHITANFFENEQLDVYLSIDL